MIDKEDLAQWAQDLNWADYVDDENVFHSLNNLKKLIENMGDPDDDEDLLRIKVVACGDGAVGKTSLLISYAQGTFPEGYVPTVFENYAKTVEDNGEKIHLHLWDTAGQEEYDRLRPLSYPGADVVLLAFSLVTKTTYESIQEKWYPEVEHYIADVPIILVGTKLDLRENEIPDPSTGLFDPVSHEEGKELMKEIGAHAYVELSAKTGDNLESLFQKVLEIGKSNHPAVAAEVARPRKGGNQKKKDRGCYLL